MAVDRAELYNRIQALRGAENTARQAESTQVDRAALVNRIRALRETRDKPSLFESIVNTPVVRWLNEFGSGVTRGAAELLDLPGRAVYGAIPGIEAPEDGFFEQQAENLGLIPEEPYAGVGPRIGREIGASAIPTAGFLAKGARVAQTLPKAVGLGRSAARIGQGVARAGKVRRAAGDAITESAEVAARNPMRFALGEAGAAAGAGTGAYVAEKVAPGSLAAEIIGQTVGSFAGAPGGAAARGVFRGGEAGRQRVASTREAFDAAGTSPTVGQATGRRFAQRTENLLLGAVGGGRVAEVADQINEDIGRRVSRISANLSLRSGAEQAGRDIASGLAGFATRFRSKATELYARLDELVPGDSQVSIENTRATLNELAAPIEGVEGLTGILTAPGIVAIREQLTAEVLPYETLRDLRSAVGRKLTGGVLHDDIPRGDLKRLYGAISDDLGLAASEAGPQAERAFRRASNYYRAGIKRIDDILGRVSSKVNPEDMFKSLYRGSREGGSTIRAVMKSLTAREREVVTATVVDRLGRATPGVQDELGEVFSPQTFLTNWNRLSPQAKRALFDWPQYGGLRENLNKIAKAAAVLKEARRTGANPSGTSGQLMQSAIWALGGGILYDWRGAAAAVGLAVGGANAASRLLTSPKFVEWLAGSTQIPASRATNYLTRLTRVVANQPALAEEVQMYLESLSELQTERI